MQSKHYTPTFSTLCAKKNNNIFNNENKHPPKLVAYTNVASSKFNRLQVAAGANLIPQC